MDRDVHRSAATQHDVDWLRAQVVMLFENATGKPEPDHVVCAKYAELLYKLLPKALGKQGSGVAAEVRAAVWQQISESATTPAEP